MSMWFIKRNRLLIGFTLSMVAAHGIQLTLINPLLSIGEYRPDLLLILTVFTGFRFGHISGSSIGFFSGLLQDLMSGFFGLLALCKTLVGYAAYYFSNRHVLVIERFYFPLVVFVMALGHDAVYYLIYSLDSSLSFRPLFMNASVYNAIYSGVFSLILIMLLPRRLSDYLRLDQR